MSPSRTPDPLAAPRLVNRVWRLARAAARPPLLLRRYAPRSMLRVPEPNLERPRFGVIDAHNHLGGAFAGRWRSEPASRLLELMDEIGIDAIVDLDGGWGSALERELRRLQEPHPDRFAVFAGIDYATLATDERFGEVEAVRLRRSVAAGARGLKIFKVLGLRARDARGTLIRVDDERLAPLWDAAAELKVPVTIHVADPLAFFEPLDRHNERYEELAAHPDWQLDKRRRAGDAAPTHAGLIEQFERLLERHRGTTFIGAHVASLAEDLAAVSRLLDEHPNLHVDIGARINELGRQPYSARDFLVRHADRVLFGLDFPPDAAYYRTAYAFLETRAEYFPYTPEERPHQGRWNIYGVDLPDDALRRIYADNARALIFDRR
jgi:predicted TIM-barrel fold metal-dependent hydrolase